MWKILPEDQVESRLRENLGGYIRQRKRAVYSWLVIGLVFSVVATVMTTFPSKVSNGITSINMYLAVTTFIGFVIFFNALFVAYWFYNYRKFSRFSDEEKLNQYRDHIKKSERKICVHCNKIHDNKSIVCGQCHTKLIGSSRCEWRET